ncbi:Mobile element protein [Methanosarcina siciliae HI350]|uniref:Mobile element protein n=1 Tax=Methanosarcina siciliae HI350 TaxID=1434119 RepID=A0A0E3PEX4_9EURY|nr:Mobile element protein [Methanosarcina siciliae HI350]
MSVPGVGELGAATLIAEIGDFKGFSSGNKLASWLGIVPNVYQSASRLV